MILIVILIIIIILIAICLLMDLKNQRDIQDLNRNFIEAYTQINQDFEFLRNELDKKQDKNETNRYIGNLFNNFTITCKSNGLDLTNLLENEKFYKSFKQIIQGQMSSLLIKCLINDNT